MPPRLLPDLVCLGYKDRVPEFVAAPRRAAVALVCGHVRLGAGAQLGASSVIRGDANELRIGEDFFLGERASILGSHWDHATRIGAGVTVGANCALRACHIAERVVMEDGVAVLEGAQVGSASALERGSIVSAGARLASGHLYRGNPACAVRRLEVGELQLLRGRVRNAPALGPAAFAAMAPRYVPGFLALTAAVEGRLALAASSSVWFGVRIDGGRHGVHLEEGANLQENCTVYAMSSPVHLGEGASVGQNVALQDCRIGEHALIGLASFVAPGTVVEPDVVLAAGSVTLPRQVLRSGWIWGGRPAQAIAPMSDEARRAVRYAALTCREHAQETQRAISDFVEMSF